MHGNRMGFAFVCGLIFLALLAGDVRSQPADSWPQFRRDPLLNGVAPGPFGVHLKVAWIYDAGTDPVESSAAIVGGVVYVGSEAGI